jgi:tetratricopeptide (TPR) repeat protein
MPRGNPPTGAKPRRAGPFRRFGSWDTALVLGAAACLRLWHLAELARMPFFRVFQMDALYHAQWAARLADRGWNDPEPFFRAPFYPYLLALVQAATGDLHWSARLLQIGLGIGTVALSHRMALRLFPRPWAFAVGMLAALLWTSIHYETELLLEPVLTFLTTLLLFLMIRASGGKPRPGTLMLWGTLAGVAAITRPNVLLFLPALPLYAATLDPRPMRRLELKRARPAGWFEEVRAAGHAIVHRLLRPAAFCLIGFLVPVLPVWVHNARHGDPATILAWQGGINFYIGNNPAANGWAAVAPNMRTDWQGGYEDAIRLAQEASGRTRSLRPSEISAYWTRQGLLFWRDEPARALSGLGRKALLFWSNLEIRNNEDPRFYRHVLSSLRFLPVSFGLLAPLALLGLAGFWKRGRAHRLLAFFITAWFLSVIPFFVCSRYRLPVTPLIPLPAIWLVREGWRSVRARHWTRVLPQVGVLLVLYPLLYAPHRDVESGGFFQSYCNLADAYSSLGRFAEAEGAYRRSIALNPGYAHSHNNLGLALEKSGNQAEAERAYREGLKVAPDHPLLRQNLGMVLESQGKLAEAESTYAQLARDHPESPDLRLMEGRVQEARGRSREAMATYSRLLGVKPQSVPAVLRLAHLQTEAGDTVSAQATVEAGLLAQPADPDLRRAQAFLRRGRGFRN